MNILALPKYSYEGPSSRYRFYNYKSCFEKNDISITIKPFFSKSYFLATNKIQKILVVLYSYVKRVLLLLNVLIFKNKYDLLLVEYELFPYFPAIFEYFLHKRGIKYIVDYDDAIFHKYDMSGNKIIHKLLKTKIAYVIKYATHVIVCNDYLKSYAQKHNDKITKLPTVVLLDNYIKEIQTFKKNDDKTFVIGWIGSKTTSFYILEILPSIKKFVDIYQDVRFNLVGFDKSLLSDEEIKTHHIHIIPWTEKEEIKNILTFDIGIMPLRDDPWSKGKCGFKLVQYMSCKKPVIASPVGINNLLVKDGENGFLVKSLDEWFLAFEKFYLDDNLNIKVSKNNFLKIKSEYNFHKNCTHYIDLLKSIVL